MRRLTDDELFDLDHQVSGDKPLTKKQYLNLGALLWEVRHLRAIVESPRQIDIVFDGPPSHESGRFVEVEDVYGRGLSVGEWIERKDGFWALRVPSPDPQSQSTQ